MAADNPADIKAELASLDAGVQSVREKLEEEGIKRDERIAKADLAIIAAHDAANRATQGALIAVIVGVVAILCGVVGITVGVVGTNAAHKAQHALADYKTATQAARIGSCEQYNAHEALQAQIEVDESHDQIALFVAASAGQPGTDPVKVRQFVADYNRRHDAKIRERHHSANRDCSVAGIAKFLEGVSTTTTRP